MDNDYMRNDQRSHNNGRNKTPQGFPRQKGIFGRRQAKEVSQKPRLGDEKGEECGEESDNDDGDWNIPKVGNMEGP